MNDRFLRLLTTVLLPLLAGFAFYRLRYYGQFQEVLPLNVTVFIFFFLSIFVGLGVWPNRGRYALLVKTTGRATALGFLATVLVILPFFTLIILRRETGDVRYTHDHPLQIEAAATMFRQGENPYRIDYRGTPVLDWGGPKNPALDHFISLPFEFLSAIPFQAVAEQVLGWYDQRFLHFVAYVLAAILVVATAKGTEVRLLVGTLFFFNPIFTPTFILGFNDIFVLSLLVVCGWFLRRGRNLAASVILGVALASKHYAVFFAAFLVAYLFGSTAGMGLRRRLMLIVRWCLPAVIVAGIIILPFLLWDSRAFVDDTIRYPAGTLSTSYPITGLGFSRGLLSSGVVQSERSAFPFWLIQLPVTISVLGLLAHWLSKRPSVGRLFFSSAITLFVFLYFSRFLNINYPGFITMLMVVGLAFASRNGEKPRTYRLATEGHG